MRRRSSCPRLTLAEPMIRDYPPSAAPTWRLIAQEALALLGIGALYPFGLAHADARTPRRREQRTVVLVHGYLSNRSALLPLAQYLRFRGLGPGAVVRLRVERGRRARRGRAARVPAPPRARRPDRPGLSQPGRAGRAALPAGARRRAPGRPLRHPGYTARWHLQRVLALVADRPRAAAGLGACSSGSQASAANAASVDFLSIVAGSDSLVIPRVFARHEREVHVPDVGHLAMLFAPGVLRRVAQHLSWSDSGQ